MSGTSTLAYSKQGEYDHPSSWNTNRNNPICVASPIVTKAINASIVGVAFIWKTMLPLCQFFLLLRPVQCLNLRLQGKVLLFSTQIGYYPFHKHMTSHKKCVIDKHVNDHGKYSRRRCNTNRTHPICVASPILTKSINATFVGAAFSWKKCCHCTTCYYYLGLYNVWNKGYRAKPCYSPLR